MVAHICNPIFGRPRQGRGVETVGLHREFQASLVYTARLS